MPAMMKNTLPQTQLYNSNASSQFQTTLNMTQQQQQQNKQQKQKKSNSKSKSQGGANTSMKKGVQMNPQEIPNNYFTINNELSENKQQQRYTDQLIQNNLNGHFKYSHWNMGLGNFQEDFLSKQITQHLKNSQSDLPIIPNKHIKIENTNNFQKKNI